jgi:transposase
MLGIDVSKDTLACALLDPLTRQTCWEHTVDNTPAGVRQLLARTAPDTPWVLEPTGRYSLAVVKQAQHAGRTVLLAPPQKAKNYLKSIQTRAKTDRLDSRGLGLYALTHDLASYPVKSDAVEHLDQLLAARKGVSDAITSLKLRIAELPHAAPLLQEAVADLQRRQKELDRQIEQQTQQAEFAAVARLLRVPGIGPVTAAAAVSRLRSKQFGHPDQFVAYMGLDIGIIQSGKRKGERGLTKEGDAELRRLFYLCAKSSIRAKGSPFRSQYDRELQKGRKKTAALCSVARKMARLCWSLVQHGTEYDPDRIYQQPKA